MICRGESNPKSLYTISLCLSVIFTERERETVTVVFFDLEYKARRGELEAHDLESKRKERKRKVGKIRNYRLSFSFCLSHGRLLYILGNQRLCIAKVE
jgi:hypothetical protein